MTNKKFQTKIKDFLLDAGNLYFTFIYHETLYICSERSQIKFNTLFDYESLQQKRITKYCN